MLCGKWKRSVEKDGLIIKTTKCCENPDLCIGGIFDGAKPFT